MRPRHLDVLIVGAGLSGVGAAVHLQAQMPSKTYAILEAREALGGTWDLFRYPGIRSDSDMFTLGYSFKPWKNPKAIADGPSILAYIRETAEEYGVLPHIWYRQRVTAASWSSEEARWTVTVEDGASGEAWQLTCRFLYACSGYYEYDHGYTPGFPGRERFRGRIVHPQTWSDDVDYAEKRVIVIGSGATAVTLVPELARSAAHVTMLQRTPTYILSRPARDRIADALRARLPDQPAYDLTRWKNVLGSMAFYQLCRRFPRQARRLLLGGVRKLVGDSVDVDMHFSPPYDPWDQRLCLVPDDDLFIALREGRASVVTDHVETFTEAGIRLRSGRELEADLVVTATGLEMKFLGGVRLEVDGREVVPAESLVYKGMMLSDVPNAAMAVGYTNASWTLKCELTTEYVCRLLAYMDAKGYRSVTPRRRDPKPAEEPLIDFTSGYVRRAADRLPRQGSFAPWKLYQNYALDLLTLRHGAIDDGTVELAR
jgi:cation diffusion facilitator CzcD-associated flavoprotein CzcO